MPRQSGTSDSQSVSSYVFNTGFGTDDLNMTFEQCRAFVVSPIKNADKDAGGFFEKKSQ